MVLETSIPPTPTPTPPPEIREVVVGRGDGVTTVYAGCAPMWPIEPADELCGEDASFFTPMPEHVFFLDRRTGSFRIVYDAPLALHQPVKMRFKWTPPAYRHAHVQVVLNGSPHLISIDELRDAITRGAMGRNDWRAIAGSFYADFFDDGGAVGAGHPRHYRRPDDVAPIKLKPREGAGGEAFVE